MVAWFVTAAASAQDPTPDVVLVVLADCAESPFDSVLLEERLRVELTSDGVRETRFCAEGDPALSVERPGLAIVRIAHVPCTAESATFTVRIDDFVTRKRVERTLDLEETPREARLRALALATGELLRASWAELAVAAPSADVPEAMLDGVAMRVRVRGLRDAWSLAPPVVVPARTTAEPREPTPRGLSTSIAAALIVRAFPSAGIAPLGGRISLDIPPSGKLLVKIDVEVGVATSLDDPLGTIDIGLATMGLALAHMARLGPEVVLVIGPHASFGAAWASGSPRAPGAFADSGAGPVVLLGAALELDVQVVAGFSARFGLDVSGTALGFDARVGAVPVTGISGAAIGVWAGFALAP